MLGYHFVARTRHHQNIFNDFHVAQKTWFLLQRNFPTIYGACLMPNHIHLLVPKPSNLSVSNQLFNRSLNTIALYAKAGPHLWETTPPPSVIPDAYHLQRQIRYTHLNPCRKELIADPLGWIFSTHRDLLNLRLHPWLRLHEVPVSHKKTSHQWHQYISGDPSVNLQGTAPPTQGQQQDIPQFGVAAIQRAVNTLIATESLIYKQTQRQILLLNLLQDQGYRERRILMDALGVKKSRLCEIQNLPPNPTTWIKMARIYLYDERLAPDYLSGFLSNSAGQVPKPDK